MPRAYIQNVKPPSPIEVPLRVDAFFGGLNNASDSALILESHQSPDLCNVTFKDKILRKRNGYIKAFAAQLAEVPRRLFTYEKNDGSKYTLVCSDTKLYKVAPDGNSFIFIQNITKPIDGLSYADKFLFVDGAGYYEYDGSVVTTITNASYVPTTNELNDPFGGSNTIPIDCTMIALKENRIWLAGSISKPNVAFHSALNNHKYFPMNGFVPPLTNDDQTITGIVNYMDVLVIFKQDSVHALYGNNPDPTGLEAFSLKRVNTLTGTLSYKSLAKVENYLYYLGTNGRIYSLYPVRTNTDYIMAKDVSENINIFKDPISTPFTPLDPADLSKANAVYFEGQYYLCINSKITLVFNYLYQSWTMYRGINATDFMVYDYNLYFTGTEKYIYKYGIGFNDDGRIIDSYWYSKVYDFNYPYRNKQFRKVYVTSQTKTGTESKLDVVFKVDFMDVYETLNFKFARSVWGASHWGDLFINTDLAMSPPVNINKRGKLLQIKIKNNILDEDFNVIEINGIVEVRPN